jgi:hypothetical protein
MEILKEKHFEILNSLTGTTGANMKSLLTYLNVIQTFANNLNIRLRVFDQDSLRFAASLDEKRQEDLILAVKERAEFLNSIEIDPFKSNTHLVNYILRRLGLKCDENFIKSLKDGDIVEIYSTDNKQLFANFEFFSLSNYSLLDMVSHTWDDLFERNADITKNLGGIIYNAMMNASQSQSYAVKPHVVREKLSNERQSFVIHMGELAPCFSLSDGTRAGMIHSLRAANITTDKVLNIYN